MPSIADRIIKLDDTTAVRLLTSVTDALQRRDENAFATEPTGDVRTAVADLANREQAPIPKTVTDGDLARTALLVLAEDEKQARALETLLDGPPAENYTGLELVLAAGAILVALQTRVKIIVKDGKTQLEIAKPSLSSKHLLDLARQLTAWLKAI